MTPITTPLTEHLTKAIEVESNVLQFTLPDHKAEQEKLSAIHHAAIAKKTAAISSTKASLRRTIDKLDAEIQRLQHEKLSANTSAEALIAANQHIIKASQAFIDAVEGVDD